MTGPSGISSPGFPQSSGPTFSLWAGTQALLLRVLLLLRGGSEAWRERQTQSHTWGPRSLTIGHHAGFLEGGVCYVMGQVTSQALEVGGDGALELVFHVNAHPLVHVAGEGWESAESWALCQYVLLEASVELLSIHPMFPPPRAERSETDSSLLRQGPYWLSPAYTCIS